MGDRPTIPRQGGGNQMANGAGPGLVVSSSLPHAGYQQDLNYVYSLLGELSDVLRENRDTTQHIRESVARVQTRSGTAVPPSLHEVNAELNGVSNSSKPQIAHLESQVSTLTTQRDHALHSLKEMNEINELYQDTMTTMMDKIRSYIYTKEVEVIAVHRKYNDELQLLKDTNQEIRLEHGRWQEGLGKSMEAARKALRAVSAYEAPYECERRELREENRMLRWQLGYERRLDDVISDEEEVGAAEVRDGEGPASSRDMGGGGGGGGGGRHEIPYRTERTTADI